MNKLFTQLVEKRGLSSAYLAPKYTDLTPARKMPDIKKATARIKDAIKNREKILIYGDYDVDGVTASTLMHDTLELAGAKPSDIEIMLPDRFIDGYGMSPRLVKQALDHHVNLVITVDCGSRNHDIITDLANNHIDTIITDHHECTDNLPDAVAIINPKRHDYSGPAELRDLAGVGVAFKLAQALVDENLIKSGQEKWLLDLVLIGTICDQMPLTLENRILTYYGLKVLEKTRRPGLLALMQSAKVKSLTSEAIGFQLGPHLNAAGRLKSAELSLELLCTHSGATAEKLAAELERLNHERRAAQRAAVNEISARDFARMPVIVEAGKWHEGVLGIIAGRLVEKYHKPAFVLAETESGIYKGSGRSFGDFNLATALIEAGDTILGGGGHAAAAGVKLKGTNLDAFRQKISSYYNSLHLTDQERFFRATPDLTITSLAGFNLDLIADLGTLEPFGPGNEEPLFCLDGATAADYRHMGADGDHLRLDLQDASGQILKSVAFSAPQSWFHLAELATAHDPEAPHRFLIRPTLNEWQGTRSCEARLVDILA